MNNRSKEIIEDAISQGKWVWVEIDDIHFISNLKISNCPQGLF